MFEVREKIKIILGQRSPLRFTVSRLLREAGLLRLPFLIFRRNGYKLRLHPSALSLALWVDPKDRCTDSEVLKAVLRPGDSYVDVGANVGHLTIEAALIMGTKGTVTAFEAHPRTAQFLRENLRLNGLTNVRVAQVAVGDVKGWVAFSDNLRTDDQNAVSPNGSIIVPCAPLDSFSLDEQVTFLKIDVEGYEKYVLQGAKSVLARTQFVYFEAWDEHYKKYNYSFRDMADMLQGFGFEVGELKQDSIRLLLGKEKIPVCTNLLAFRSRAFLTDRTGWKVHG